MRALLLLALFSGSPVQACECASEAVARLSVNPEIAETALLGKAERSHSTTVFRVEASWTKYAGAVALPLSSKCDLHPALGRKLILLSIHSLDWYAEHKASPTICDSVLLEPAKAGKAVGQLAVKTDGSNPSWGYCQRNKDCVLSPGVCGGQDVVHARYKVQHDAWRDRVAPTMNCAGGRELPGLKARCEENFCAAYAPTKTDTL